MQQPRTHVFALILLLAFLTGCPGYGGNDDDDDSAEPPCTDADADGYCAEDDDCDDADADISPAAVEACDGIDNDCSGAADFAGEDTDADSDGSLACADCDDSDSTNTPGGTEICDGQDNDCDGSAGADETDDDGDLVLACDGDCDDDDDAQYPGNTETCTDGADQDCDSLVDCADPECAAETVCATEECANGVDDNLDTLVDCDDPDCSAVTLCLSSFDVLIVDDNGDVGDNCSIALDSAVDPHISYTEDDGDGDLKYAARDAGIWSTETVDDGIFAGTSSSIAVATGDLPRIAYNEFGAVNYASWSGAAWTITEASPFGGDDVSLALNTNEDPRILHHDGDLLMYLAFVEGSWEANDNITGSATAATSHFGQLRLDGDNYPHVGFINTNFYRARYGTQSLSTGDWEFEDVSTLDIIGGVSFGLDDSYGAHMVYGTLLTDEIRYAQRTGVNSWTVETIANNTGSFKEMSMELDSNNRPHVAWSSAAGQVSYTWYDGAQWNTEVLDDVGSTGGVPCLALDDGDAPHIAYYDADTGSLKYAAWAP